MDNLDEYGKGAIGILLLKQGYSLFRAWQKRLWKKEDSAESKTYQLFERLLDRERDLAPVIIRNSDVLDELLKAFETEMSQNTAAIRDLTAQIARREQ